MNEIHVADYLVYANAVQHAGIINQAMELLDMVPRAIVSPSDTGDWDVTLENVS